MFGRRWRKEGFLGESPCAPPYMGVVLPQKGDFTRQMWPHHGKSQRARRLFLHFMTSYGKLWGMKHCSLMQFPRYTPWGGAEDRPSPLPLFRTIDLFLGRPSAVVFAFYSCFAEWRAKLRKMSS